MHLDLRRGFALAVIAAAAHALPEPTPAITAAPVKRQDPARSTYGYSFNSAVSSWSPVAFSTASWNFLTSGDYFGLCTAPNTNCILATGCSGQYKVYPSVVTPSFCTEGQCGSDVLYSSPGGPAQTRIWCDVTNQHGISIYKQTVSGAIASPTTSSRRTTPTGSTTGSSTGSESTTGDTATSSSTDVPPPSSGSSTNVGAIVGGVIGGLAVIGIIATALVFLLLRHKRKNANDAMTPAPAAPAMGQQTTQPEYYHGDPKYGQYQAVPGHGQQGYAPQPIAELASTPAGPYDQEQRPISELPAGANYK